MRTGVSNSSRQVGLYLLLIVLHFIRSTSRKAKQNTAGRKQKQRGEVRMLYGESSL
jgi:hypothetical protein